MTSNEFIAEFNKLKIRELKDEDYLKMAEDIKQNMPDDEFSKFKNTSTGRIFGDIVSSIKEK